MIHKHTPQTIIHTACLSLCHWESIKSLLLMGCYVRHDSSSRIYPAMSESHKQTTLTQAKIIPKILKISKKSQRSPKNPKDLKKFQNLLRKKSLIKPPLMSTNRVYIPDSSILPCLPHTNAPRTSDFRQILRYSRSFARSLGINHLMQEVQTSKDQDKSQLMTSIKKS